MSESKKYTVATHGAKITGFLNKVIEQVSLEVTFQIVEGVALHPEIENPDLTVQFSGKDVDLLLENRGEMLLALEHLTSELLRVPSEEHSLLCFDANDYRMLRMEELRMSALAAAERVKKTGQPFRFNPMTSRERRIVHLALREEKEVVSESFGTGPTRQVVVYAAGQPKPNIPLAPPPRRGGFGDRGGDRGGDRPRFGDRGPRRDGGRDGGRDGRDSGRQRGPRPRNT